MIWMSRFVFAALSMFVVGAVLALVGCWFLWVSFFLAAVGTCTACFSCSWIVGFLCVLFVGSAFVFGRVEVVRFRLDCEVGLFLVGFGGCRG